MATLPLFEQPTSTVTINGNAAIIARERQKSLMLRAWILSGLFFMALPGTLLGFSNLMAISAHHGLGTLPAAWIEGHGHAQMFGWIGSFILGIGFYSQPAHGRSVLRVPLSCYVLWTSGVGMRWFANIYGWHWRALLPISAGFELMAVILFLYAASHHKLPASTQGNRAKPPMELWMVSVLIGTAGARVRRDFQFCRVRSIVYAGRPSVLSALARSEISRSAWLGICRSGSLGIFGAMAADVSRDLEAQCSLVSGSIMHGFGGRSLGVAGWPKPATILFCFERSCGRICTTLCRTAPWACKNSGYPSKLSDLHPSGLCLADRGWINECMGCIFRCARRHLGRLTSCANSRICSDDGVRNWATHPASLHRDSKYLQ